MTEVNKMKYLFCFSLILIASVFIANDSNAAVVECKGGQIITDIGSATYLEPGRPPVEVYGGSQAILDIASCGVDGHNGVVTFFSQGGIYYSPDCRNIGGGGSTTLEYSAGQAANFLGVHGDGVRTRFEQGGVYCSPDCRNIGGGGNTTRC